MRKLIIFLIFVQIVTAIVAYRADQEARGLRIVVGSLTTILGDTVETMVIMKNELDRVEF